MRQLIQRALNREPSWGGHKAEREQAGRELLTMPPPPGDELEPDWKVQKREILDAPMQKWPGA